MKKVFLSFAVVAGIVLASCNNKVEEPATEVVTETTETTVTEPVETVVVDTTATTTTTVETVKEEVKK